MMEEGSNPVVIVADSVLKIGNARKTDGAAARALPTISYEDIGGLTRISHQRVGWVK